MTFVRILCISLLLATLPYFFLGGPKEITAEEGLKDLQEMRARIENYERINK